MNGYCRLSHVKADIAGMVNQLTSLDDVIVRQVEEVSREFDSETGRQFYSYVATKTLTAISSGRVWLPDLLTATTIKTDTDQDATYETTLVAADYYLGPENATNEPYRELLVNSTGSVGAWPLFRSGVQVVGLWGYSNETEDTLQQVKDAAGINASVTTITVTSVADIDPGDTLVIESEQVNVLTLGAAGTTITVTRGINGTTAAAHAKDTPIYRRRFPRRIEQVVKERVVGLRWDTQGGYTAGQSMAGESNPSRAAYARWFAATAAYRCPGAVL